MENINSAISAIDREIEIIEKRLIICQQILEKFRSLDLVTGTEVGTIIDNLGSTTDSKPPVAKIDLEQYKDYPFNKRLLEKLHYLDGKFPKAWKMKNRLELMVQIEGESSRGRFQHMSQDLKSLVQIGLYLGAKYSNDNKTQFYCRPEWVNEEEGCTKHIKDEYKPNDEDFGTMPHHKRRDELITWVTSKQ